MKLKLCANSLLKEKYVNLMYKTPDVDYVKELQLYNATIYKMFPEGKMLVLPKQNSHQSQLRVKGLIL